MNSVELPIVFFTEKGRGAHGKFRFPEHHLIEINGKPSVNESVIPENAERKTGTIVVPELIVASLGEIAEKLASGMDQTGLYTGRSKATNNCARFVHDISGVGFDRRLLEDTRIYNGWYLTPQEPEHKPLIGEVTVYTRPHAGSWAHWGMGVDGDIPGVMGLGGPNGHAISIAENWDIAKAQGHTQPNTAIHPNYNHLA